MTAGAPAPQDDGEVVALLRDLGPDRTARVAELTVFGSEVPVPRDSVSRLWARTAGLPRSAAGRLRDRLLGTGLLVAAGGGRVLVPVAVVDHLGDRLGADPSWVHRAVVGSHRDLVPVRGGVSAWAELEVEYLWYRLPEHLVEAGLADELTGLLDDPRWVLGRWDRVGPLGLRGDLRKSSDPAHRAMAAAVPARAAWPDRPDEVPLRLAARTPPEDAAARQRLDAAPEERFRSGGPDLAVPYLLALHHVVDAAGPDDAVPADAATLLRALAGAADRVTAPDGAWLAVAGVRPEVRLCDPRTGALLHTLHTPGVGRPAALAVTPDGSWLAAADRDGRVALWRPFTVRGADRTPVRERVRLLMDGPAPGPDHPAVLAVRHHLAHWRGTDGAVAALTSLVADLARVLGPDDAATLGVRHSLARWRAGAGAAHADVLADRVRVLGADHPASLASRHDLACARGDDGDPVGALTDLTAVVADRRRVLGADHPETLTARANLAHRRRAAGADAADDPDDPDTDHLGHVVEDHVRVLGPEHPAVADLRRHLVHWLADRGRPDRAAAVVAPTAHERSGTGPVQRVAQEHLARFVAAAEEGTAGACAELLPPSAAHLAAQALARLPDEERERCDELVVFDGPVAEEVVDRLWARTGGWSPVRGRALRGRLVELGLLDGGAGSAVQVPGEVGRHLRRRVGERRAALHRALVDAHRDLVPVVDGASRWSDLDPARTDWLLRLPAQLERAGLHDERAALLRDPRWTVDALDRRGPDGLAAELGPGPVADVLRREAHLLAPLDPPGSPAATLASRLRPDEADGLRGRLLDGITGPFLARVGPVIADPTPLRRLGGVDIALIAVVVAPDGSWLAGVELDAVHVWDPAEGRRLHRIDGGPYCEPVEHLDGRGCAATPDSTALAVVRGQDVEVIDPRAGVVLRVLDDPDGTAPRLALSPDASWLATTSWEVVLVHDPATGELLAELDGHVAEVAAIAAAPDGSWLATTTGDGADGDEADGEGTAVRIWDPCTGEVCRTLRGTDGEAVELAVAPDGSWLATIGERVQFWDPADGTLLHTAVEADCRNHRAGTVVAVAPDSGSIAYAGREGATVVVRDRYGRRRHVLTTDGYRVDAVAFAPDGRWLATAASVVAQPERVQLWDAATGRLAADLPGRAPIVFAPDGAWLAIADDGGAALWPLPPGPGRPSPARTTVGDPDGSWTAASLDDGTVLVRGPSGGTQHVLRGHRGPVTALAAAPDGTRLASGGHDGTLRVWDPATGRALTALRVGFPPSGLELDGRGRLVARQDDAVHVFELVEGGAAETGGPTGGR
jgi:WD40 repeat protein